jgi:hypothetical protein
LIETALCIALAKSLVADKIEYYSKELGAYEGMVDYIVRNESNYNNCAKGDLHVQKPSLGLVQINLHYNPTVAPAQAYDADFAIQYLINDLKAGKCSKWTTCRWFKQKYPTHPYFQLSNTG